MKGGRVRVWVVDGKKFKRLGIIIVAAFFAALMLFVEKQNITVFSNHEQTLPQAISKVKTGKKEVALTFDINWGEVRIQQILNILDTSNIKATFFVSGEWADAHKDLIEEMKEKGQEVASHGMQHEAYTDLKYNEIRRDILLANTSIEKASGTTPVYLRPPEGKINNDVLKLAQLSGQQLVLWSVNSNDEANRGAGQIVKTVVSQSSQGDIIRMHASDTSKYTAAALPDVISGLQDKGLHFVTLSELIRQSNAKTKLLQ